MSGPDQADDDKSFLARWSQRKQQAKKPEQDASPADAAEAEPAIAAEAPQEFDLSSLPKLEELTSSTDITAFLRKGVPEHLRNAALRKSWALDPAIRNYINPALDYAYDWNTPGGVPGSSEIGAGMDVARMVSQIMGSGEAETDLGEAVGDSALHGETDQTPLPEPVPVPELPNEALRLSGVTIPEPETGSANDGESVMLPQREANSAQEFAATQHQVRRHGSAKPVL